MRTLFEWIGIIAVVLIGKFLYDLSQQKKELEKDGGVVRKYATLIAFIMAVSERNRMHDVRADGVTIADLRVHTNTVIHIIETFGTVTIQWNLESIAFGKHRLEWEFNAQGDQRKMFEIFARDVSEYQQRVLEKFLS